MTTIPLDLLVDASGMVTGARDARDGLDSIVSRAKDTEAAVGGVSTSMTTTGASMREAFGATKGGLQVTTGLQGIITGMSGVASGAKDLSSVAQNTGRLLLEVSKAGQEFGSLTTAMRTFKTVTTEVIRDEFGIATGTRDIVNTSREMSSGIGNLWGVMKANPLMAVAGGLGLVSTAMTALGSLATKTRGHWDEFMDGFKRVGGEERIGIQLGSDQIQQAVQNRRMQLLYEAAVKSEIDGKTPSTYEVFRMFGGSFEAVARDPNNLNRFNMTQTLGRNLLGGENPRTPFEGPMDRDQFLRMLQAYGKLFDEPEIKSQFGNTNIAKSVWWDRDAQAYQGPYRPGEWPGKPPAFSLKNEVSAWEAGQNQVRVTPEQLEAIALKNAEENRQKSLQHMHEMISLGRQLGETIGDAFANVTNGTQTSQQALQSLLQMFERMALQQAFGAAGAQIGGWFGRASPSSAPAPAPRGQY